MRPNSELESDGSIQPTSNPFASRFIRPGGVPYFEAHPGLMADMLVRLQKLNMRAAILGPHGCGKSTLGTELNRQLEQQGVCVRRIQLTQATIDRSAIMGVIESAAEGDFVSIDGFERLRWLARRKIIRLTNRKGIGLLVTSHRSCGLPVLTTLTPCDQRFVQIVDHLLTTCSRLSSTPNEATQACREWRLGWSDQRLAKLLRSQGGNIREALFALYDDWEQARKDEEQ